MDLHTTTDRCEDALLHATVPAALEGQRLDAAMARIFGDYSRSILKRWIEEGRVRIDGNHGKPRQRLAGGEQIELHAAPRRTAIPWRAEPLTLTIIHEDPHLLIINKPPALVVHPGAGNPHGTLVNGLLHFDPTLEQLPRAGLIHRLDKDTSGLLVVARTPSTYQALVTMLAERRIKREYLGLVSGRVIAGGTIDAPVGRHRTMRTRMAVTDRGKAARTHYRIARRFTHHTELKLILESGRTHQIRVHMAHLGHPIVGDPLYSGRGHTQPGASTTLHEALAHFKRQALHARQLSFIHPATGEALSWSTPPPADLTALIEHLTAE